jgi:hypothetical protein
VNDYRSILHELQRMQAKYSEVNSETGNAGIGIERVWKIRVVQEENKALKGLQSRIHTHIAVHNTLRGQFALDDNLLRHQENQGHQAILDSDRPVVTASATETSPTNTLPTGIKVLYDPEHSDFESVSTFSSQLMLPSLDWEHV